MWVHTMEVSSSTQNHTSAVYSNKSRAETPHSRCSFSFALLDFHQPAWPEIIMQALAWYRLVCDQLKQAETLVLDWFWKGKKRQKKKRKAKQKSENLKCELSERKVMQMPQYPNVRSAKVVPFICFYNYDTLTSELRTRQRGECMKVWQALRTYFYTRKRKKYPYAIIV